MTIFDNTSITVLLGEDTDRMVMSDIDGTVTILDMLCPRSESAESTWR